MIYVYGLVPAWETEGKPFPVQPGIDGKHETSWKRHGDICAWVCEVEASEFSQEKVDRCAQDPIWLQEKGQHHHLRIVELQQEFTVVPMSFCTVFENEASLERTLMEKNEGVLALFSQLVGHHEWSVKVYSRWEQLKQYVLAHHEATRSLLAEIEQMPTGKKFLMKKKLDQQIDAIVTSEIEARWAVLHERLTDVAARNQSKPNWSKAMTGREEDMVYNGVYLVSDDQIDRFLALIEAQKGETAEGGWVFECTGPWPPYHFAKLARED